MIEVTAQGSDVVFSKPALAFVEELHRAFESRRQELLQKRAERYRKLSSGASFEFLPKRPRCAAATGRSLQRPRICRSATSRSPVRSSAR